MKLVTARDVQRLTGLTADQLREWTTRRGLIEPDRKPTGPGSRAMYSWQTVLVLRIAVVLKEILHVELHAQRSALSKLTQRVRKSSFPSLRGKVLFVSSNGRVDLSAASDIAAFRSDGIILRLDPHLDVLAVSFGGPKPIHQLPLFPAVAVR